MDKFPGEPDDAAVADMISDAVALATNYFTQPDGPRPDGTTEADMLWALIHERSGDEFVESVRVMNGLLAVITILGDWHQRATGVSTVKALQQIARENERRLRGQG
jgi:hypothetical protein